MARLRLTDTSVRNLPIPLTGKKVRHPDDRIPRFQVQVTRDGAKSYIIRYSANRQERQYTIGRFPDWPTEMAREEAKRLLQLVDQGLDPKAQRDETRSAPTVKDLAQRFLDEYAAAKRSSYRVNNTLLLRKWVLPELGGRKVADVEQRHIGELHRKITKAGSPVMANRAVSCASRLFSLAVRWGYRADNPCRHAVDRNVEMQRRVYLNPAQIGELAKALDNHVSKNAADCIRLIMLTGCRRGEAMAARVEQIDIDQKLWRLPAASTKQAKPNEIPLSAPALQLVERLVPKAERTGYLFPNRDGDGHITDLKKSWMSLRKQAGLPDKVRLHDLRHSFASIAVSRGATLPLIGALLGHSNPATTARYAHLYDDPQRALAESVAEVITGNSGGKILPLRRRP